MLLRRIGIPLRRCCFPDDTAVMIDLLLSSIACTCASIVAQKSSMGISTLSSPNGLNRARRKNMLEGYCTSKEKLDMSMVAMHLLYKLRTHNDEKHDYH